MQDLLSEKTPTVRATISLVRGVFPTRATLQQVNKAFFTYANSPLVDEEFCMSEKTVRQAPTMRATSSLVRGVFSTRVTYQKVNEEYFEGQRGVLHVSNQPATFTRSTKHS